jgi:hypothetical protein
MSRFYTTRIFVASVCSLLISQLALIARCQAPAPAAQSSAPVLVAKFATNLNTRSAKSGDAVVAKTIKDLKLKDLDIPKGSKIVGTVASVQSREDSNGDSSLAIRFDHVELKGNQVLRIQGLIVAIGPAPDSGAGLGFNSVLGRGGVGSTPGLDPNAGAEHSGKDELPEGSTLEGVALAKKLDAQGASELHGVHRDIKIDSDVMIRVALYHGA